jgi:flagellar basal-body rod protein FlgC
MDIISENLANVNTTKTENGGPYKRKVALFEAQYGDRVFAQFLETAVASGVDTSWIAHTASSMAAFGNGVRVSRVTTDETQGPRVYEPSHPDADEEGYVTMPNVNVVTEMINLIGASRAYEANVTSMNVTKSIMAKTLEIGRQ